MKPAARYGAEDAPRMYESDVVDKLRSELSMQEFLFYRTGFDEFDMLICGEESKLWECQCTACGQTFLEEKSKIAPRHWTHCPRCGMKIEPRRWDARKPLDEQQLSYYIFQPDGERMWVRGYQIARLRDASFDAFEYARMVFYPGGSKRWTRSRDYLRGVHAWQERREAKLKLWHSGYGYTRENWIGRIQTDEIRGTCIAYSQLDRAIGTLHDPIAYLALYVKYPICEYLWKMGFGWMFRARENDRAGFQRCVNLRAKKPRDLLKGLTKQDVRVLKPYSRFGTIEAYRKLRACGAINPDEDGAAYADAAASTSGRVLTLCIEQPELHSYFKRQKKRSGLRYHDLLRDWGDYLREIDEIGGGEMLPDDLEEAHRRLSARLRKKRLAGLTREFRVRRHLLRQYCWHWGGMLVRPVDSEEEILREGEIQNNCVAGYAARHAQGETCIFVLRRAEQPGVPWCTVEYRPEKNMVVQCRAYRNGSAPPEADEFMKRWCARNAALTGRNLA